MTTTWLVLLVLAAEGAGCAIGYAWARGIGRAELEAVHAELSAITARTLRRHKAAVQASVKGWQARKRARMPATAHEGEK